MATANEPVLSDEELKRLVEKVTREVTERQDEARTLRNQADKIQADIDRTQLERSEFTKQVYRAEEISPLVEQCVQVRQALETKRRHLEAVTTGTATECSDLRRLREELEELESGAKIAEKSNKENMSSLTMSYDLALREQEEISEKLTLVQSKCAEISQRQEHRMEEEANQKEFDAKVERFLRKACEQTGVQLPQSKTAQK